MTTLKDLEAFHQECIQFWGPDWGRMSFAERIELMKRCGQQPPRRRQTTASLKAYMGFNPLTLQEDDGATKTD